MKINSVIFFRLLPCLLLIGLLHFAFLYFLKTENNFVILFKIYAINFLLTATCLYLVSLIHVKAPEHVGFSYLFLVLFKIVVVVSLLLTTKEFKNNVISFMVSYLFSLLIEVYLIIKWIFISEK